MEINNFYHNKIDVKSVHFWEKIYNEIKEKLTIFINTDLKMVYIKIHLFILIKF